MGRVSSKKYFFGFFIWRWRCLPSVSKKKKKVLRNTQFKLRTLGGKTADHSTGIYRMNLEINKRKTENYQHVTGWTGVGLGISGNLDRLG